MLMRGAASAATVRAALLFPSDDCPIHTNLPGAHLAAVGQEFAHKGELTLARENHAAVMRELKRMQDEPGYVSVWEPKTILEAEQAAPADEAALTVCSYSS
jgi:hypothetical protein